MPRENTKVADVLVLFSFCAALSMAARGAEPPSIAARRTPVVEAYERVRDSVVNISTTQKVQVPRLAFDVFGFPEVVGVPSSRTSVGSGFVIHEDGYIATNAHVVAAADELAVTFADGSKYEAVVIGRDVERDLAVVKIEPDRPLKPIVFGRSDDLMIGETTIAIGNPVGLQNTLTTGVISALHRELNIDGRVIYKDVVQTDASINPGNSGGPLLNILGELIGVNTAVRTDVQNIGFAIPVGQLKELLPEILDPEQVNNVQVGVRLGGTTPARVVYLREEGPATRAGLKLGDIVESVDGRPVRGPLDFYVTMLAKRAEDVVSFRILRDGKSMEKRMTLLPVPRPDGRQLALARLGIVIDDVKDAAARKFRWSRQGALVTRVEAGGPAYREDIRPGDLLITMGRHYISDVDHFGSLIAHVRPGDTVPLAFRRRTPDGRLMHGEVRLYAR